jgi:hypothetical protein
MTGNKIRDPRNNQLASLHIITDPILSPVMWKRKQYRTFRTWNAGNQRNWQASIKHRVWRLTAQMCLQASGQTHTSTWRPAWHSEARPWADYVPMSRGISDRASGHISLPRQSIITTTDQNYNKSAMCVITNINIFLDRHLHRPQITYSCTRLKSVYLDNQHGPRSGLFFVFWPSSDIHMTTPSFGLWLCCLIE